MLKSPSRSDALNGLMMNMCAVAGFASSGICFDADLDLAQRADESVRTAGNRRAAGVGVELAGARDRRLNQHRRNRRQDDRRDQRERVGALAVVAAVAAAAEEHREARNHHDRGGQRRRHRADQDVAMLDVRQLVRRARLRAPRRSAAAECLRSRPPRRAPGCGRSRTRSATHRESRSSAAAAGRRASPADRRSSNRR